MTLSDRMEMADRLIQQAEDADSEREGLLLLAFAATHALMAIAQGVAPATLVRITERNDSAEL